MNNEDLAITTPSNDSLLSNLTIKDSSMIIFPSIKEEIEFYEFYLAAKYFNEGS